ncbi:uncharacterized protein [Choristoneura fumiferana]|uniref:uncharacterized protein n=1 Tax=Choristoneura fumiferana TaxID=7141 RepID=UPI003D15859C
MSVAARWLAAACALAACGDALADLDVTWPGCSRSRQGATMEVVQPGQTNTHVTGIHLNECNFKTVNLESLRAYPNVKDIELSNINVTNITALTFDSFTDLQLLTMEKNSILGKNLPSDLFRKCRRLNYINFKDNDMRDTPADLMQGLDLTTLFLHNCNLKEVPSFFTSQMFPHMDYFVTDHNEISKIHPTTFANAVSLTTLSLSYNRIKYLHVDLLKPLTKIRWIYLDNNKLLHIPEALFQHNPSLEYVNLSHNQIKNIPSNAFLGTNLKELYLNDNRLTHLPQKFIINLHSTGISLNIFHFHGNPWECAYLNKLLVMIKKFKIRYDSSQYNGHHQACTYKKLLAPMIIHEKAEIEN